MLKQTLAAIRANLPSLGAWLNQTTTVLGLAGLAATAAGYFAGATDWKTTLILLVPAAVALALPGSAAAPAQARKMLVDLLALVAAKGTGTSIPAFASDVVAFAGTLHPDTPVVPLSALTSTVPAPVSGPNPAAVPLALVLLVACCLGLSACGSVPTAGQALQLYGIDKGIALEAAKANPAIAPDIDAALAKTDAIAAKAQAGQALAADVESLVSQADALVVQAAPLVTVVANTPKR